MVSYVLYPIADLLRDEELLHGHVVHVGEVIDHQVLAVLPVTCQIISIHFVKDFQAFPLRVEKILNNILFISGMLIFYFKFQIYKKKKQSLNRVGARRSW